MDVGVDETSTGGIDAAENIYETAKGVFLWTKNVPVVGFFTGMSESLAANALKIVGTNLPDVDETIENHIVRNIDGKILNPVLGTAVNVLMAVGRTTENIVINPIVSVVTFPFRLLIKSDADEKTPSHNYEEEALTENSADVVVAATSPEKTGNETAMVETLSNETIDTMTDISSIGSGDAETALPGSESTSPTKQKMMKNVITGISKNAKQVGKKAQKKTSNLLNKALATGEGQSNRVLLS